MERVVVDIIFVFLIVSGLATGHAEAHGAFVLFMIVLVVMHGPLLCGKERGSCERYGYGKLGTGSSDGYVKRHTLEHVSCQVPKNTEDTKWWGWVLLVLRIRRDTGSGHCS